jgi:thioredoxin reductase
MEEAWDCVVVGGGAAGLSAALVLGRALRRTLVVDAGEQSNLPAEGVGGLLGNDRRPPAELYDAGRAEIAGHPSVEVRGGVSALEARAAAEGFEIELDDGSRAHARKLLLAGGMEYRTPQLPGLRERWGGAVFHCPFCHGWEVREGRLAVLGAGEAEVERAVLLRAWSDDVTLLADGGELPSERRERLAAAGVKVDLRPLAALAEGEEALVPVRFEDGSELALDGLLVAVTLYQRSRIAARLGVDFAPWPVSEETIAVDDANQTSVPGVYAAGDVCTQAPSVAGAVAAGSFAATRIVHALMAGRLC